MSSFEWSFKPAEVSLAKTLEARRASISGATGEGAATEDIVQECLLRPHLPSCLRCGKGAVLAALDPSSQSPAIDRVVYDVSAACSMLYEEPRSIFPIEAVAR